MTERVTRSRAAAAMTLMRPARMSAYSRWNSSLRTESLPETARSSYTATSTQSSPQATLYWRWARRRCSWVLRLPSSLLAWRSVLTRVTRPTRLVVSTGMVGVLPGLRWVATVTVHLLPT
ncbi:MAG: hypothetical protein HY689_14130 [Chloroflexi bacterium]|nr:hypothetical protein [Chloroflexota bacterium]